VWGCFVYLPNCLTFPTNNSVGALQNDGAGVLSWTALSPGGFWNELGGVLSPTNAAAVVTIPNLVVTGNALSLGATSPVGIVKNTNDTSLRINIAGYETEKFYAASHYWLGDYRLGWLYDTIDSNPNLELTHEANYTLGIQGPGSAVLRLYGETNSITGIWSRLEVTSATTNHNVTLDVQNSTGNAGGYVFKSNGTTLLTISTNGNITVHYSLLSTNLLLSGVTYTDNGSTLLRNGSSITGAGLWSTNSGSGTISPIGAAGIEINAGPNAAPNELPNLIVTNLLTIPFYTPASSSETNYEHAICADASYIYFWTATNANKRAALDTW
jgi:hypothetical protein